MSSRQLRALFLSCMLVVSLRALPLAAAPRDGGRDRGTPVERIITHVRKFVAGILDELTMPKP